MTTESMSIHRALVELKTIDSRIIKKIDSAKFCVAAKAKATKLGAITVDEFKTSAQASYDSAMDLINRRNAIKAAVSKSNAVTEISVNNKTYTVAEAISLKQHGMEYLDYLRSHIQAQYSNETSQITSANLRVEDKADDMVKSICGGDSKTKDADPETVAKIRNTYLEQNSMELVDGLTKGCTQIIEDLQTQIDSFNNEIDSALSVSNAVTQITFSY